LNKLTTQEISDLLYVVAVQYSRVKIHRKNKQSLIKDINKFTKKILGEGFQILNEISDEEAKIETVKYLSNIDELVKDFLNKEMVLYRNVTKDDFWTSDNPVIMENLFPYGKIGPKELGIQIMYPISDKLILALICKSVNINLQELNNNKESYKIQKTIFENKIPVLATEDLVSRFNTLQAINASRFIYSGRNNFSMAKEIVNKYPKIKEVTKNWGIVEGNKNYKMPKGDYLVAYFEDSSFMIPVSNVKSEFNIEFKTTKFELFVKNTRGKVIELTELYENQKLYRAKRNLRVIKANKETKLATLGF